jgi:hypothetical protein
VPTVFLNLLENDNDDPSKATHRRVARFKEKRSMGVRLGVPNAEGAQKREILSAGRFLKIYVQ